jgi:uncharacterized damage-inducible protein DinB
MISLEYFRDLFAYDRWSNERVLGSLSGLDGGEELVKLLAHVLGSQQVWISRIEHPESASVEAWPELSLDACRPWIAERYADGERCSIRSTMPTSKGG